MEVVFSVIRKICKKQPDESMEDLTVNVTILGNAHEFHTSSSSSSRKKYAKNYIWDSLGQLIEEIKRLICELSEILGPRTSEIVWFENN